MTTDDLKTDKQPPLQESELPADEYTFNDGNRSLSEQKRTLFQQVPLDPNAANLDARAGNLPNMNGLRLDPIGSDEERPSSSGSAPIEHEEVPEKVPEDWNDHDPVILYDRLGKDGPHYPHQDEHQHDVEAVRRAEYLRTSSGSCNSSSTTSDLRMIFSSQVCDECNLLRRECPSDLSLVFWDDIDTGCSGDISNRCHKKYWKNFLEQLYKKCKGKVVKDNNIKELMRRLLQVEGNDSVAEVSLKNMVYAINFFGPIIDSAGSSPFLTHITEIATKLVMKSGNTKLSPFAGIMSREEAEKMLEKAQDKTYLIRMSQSEADTGNFVISVKQGEVHHFNVMGNPEAACSSSPFSANLKFAGKVFKNLPDVVDHIKSNPIIDQDEITGDEVQIWCRFVCPGLPLNSAIVKYKKTK